MEKLNVERMSKILKFAEEMIERPSDWFHTCFTDECSFWLNKCRPNKAWAQEEIEIEGKPNHGPKIHCLGGITARSALKIEIFDKNME